MADLPDLDSMTVKALRELARSELGAGHSKLKTKSQLVAALAKGRGAAAPKAVAKAAKPAVAKKPGAKPRATILTTPPLPAVSSIGGEGSERGKLPPLLRGEGGVRGAVAVKSASADPVRPGRSRGTKPAPAPLYDEHLGELPDRYEDDSFVALPVDPTTLFLYWDFNPKTTAAAASGLPSAHTVVSVHGNGQKIRELDLALESRSFYVRGLAPGVSYQAEIDFVGSDGRRQRVGRPTNAVGLPPNTASPVVDDRFIAFPWEWKRGSGKLADRPAPGAAQRGLAASGWRGGASMPLRPWLPGGSLSGRPVGK